MAGRYYRILEKARLDKELFGPDPIAEAADVLPVGHEPETIADPEQPVAPAPSEAEAGGETEVLAEAEPAARPEPALEEPPRPSVWREELAEILGLQDIPAGARVHLCPAGGLRSAAECAAALGLWMASRSSSDVLVVEASFDAPQLARLFHTRRLGLAEAMSSREPRWDHFAHETLHPKLKVLPAGRNPVLRQLTSDPAAFHATLDRLSASFESVIVILPNPRRRGFEKLVGQAPNGPVLTVIDPGRIRASQARAALRSIGARISGVLVTPRQAVEDAPHISRIAQQLGGGAAGDLHA